MSGPVAKSQSSKRNMIDVGANGEINVFPLDNPKNVESYAEFLNGESDQLFFYDNLGEKYIFQRRYIVYVHEYEEEGEE
jgi:hypothetical protein